jgi:hypothetical protein
VERRRTGGMTAMAVVNIVFGGFGILNGLYFVLGSFVLMYELLRLGVFEIPVARLAFSLLVLATGIVGLIAGIGIFRLRPWARALNLVYGGLLIFSFVAYFFVVPIIASIGTFDLSSMDAYDLVRLTVISIIHVIFPVIYSPLLYIVFSKSIWKATFAKS